MTLPDRKDSAPLAAVGSVERRGPVLETQGEGVKSIGQHRRPIVRPSCRLSGLVLTDKAHAALGFRLEAVFGLETAARLKAAGYEFGRAL